MSTSAASPSSSSSSAFSSESASTTAAPPPPPPHAPSGLLSEQLWYWPGADRAAVANALLAAPDGSFIVRDASTPGDYTLCIKFEGNTKLVKINVGKNGQCGFAPDALNHRDVMSLIAHHRANSLSYYNEKLDTKLLYPVERLRELQRGASTEESGGEQHRHSIELCETDAELMALRLHDPPAEWKRRILLERFLTACAAAGRTARIYDALHGQILHADAIVAECDKRITDYDLKAERLDEAIVRRNLHQMKQNERKDSVCSTIESRSQSDSVHGRSTAEPQLAGRSESDADAVRRGISLKANAQALMRLATMLKHERAKATAQCDEVKGAREELREALNATRVRLEKNANTCSRMEVKLLQAGFSQAQLHEEGEKIRALVLNEQHEMAESLDHLPPTWDPAAFYTQTRSKDVAARLIRRAWLKKHQEQSDDGDGSGIFLVRPSGSLAGRFVLSVLHGGERVSHCLITLHEVGWGFEKSGRYFCTLTDLVRFYSHVSLATHNPEIQTKLTRPALEAR